MSNYNPKTHIGLPNNDKSPEEIATEKRAQDLKNFDYAENPVKKWIADVLEETPDTIFSDYSTDGEFISIKCGEIPYTLKLESRPLSNVNYFEIEKDLFHATPDLTKAATLLFNAVYIVYMPVLKTMDNLSHRLEDIFPKFDEKTMSFTLTMVNGLEKSREVAQRTIQFSNEHLSKIKSTDLSNVNEDQKDQITKVIDGLQDNINKNELKLAELTQSAIDARELECTKQNEKFSKLAKLYIVASNSAPEMSSIMRRLPTFGTAYQDPDDDLVEDIKNKNDSSSMGESLF